MKYAKSISDIAVSKLCFGTLFIFFLCPLLQAQDQFKVPDSLKRKSYGYLSEKLDDDNSGRVADSVYAWTYLYKAKSAPLSNILQQPSNYLPTTFQPLSNPFPLHLTL